MRTFLLLLLLSSLIKAAPSTDIGQEIHVPLESINGFYLIDKATGAIRFITADPNNQIQATSTGNSSLTTITGATSGIMSADDETVIIASASSNRMALINTETNSITDLFPADIGPQFPAYVKSDPAAADILAVASTFNKDGDSIRLYSQPAKNFIERDLDTGLGSISCLQPFYTAPGNSRFAAGVENTPEDAQLFTVTVRAGERIRKVNSHQVPEDTLLASNVRRQDNALMLVGYVKGSNKLSLIPVIAPPALKEPVEQALPFRVASVAPADTGGDAPAGILVTSHDGRIAAHYAITADNKLLLVQEFRGEETLPINGLVTVPGKGLIALSGKSTQASSHFNFHSWNGSAWRSTDAGDLPGLSDAGTKFATLFWFSAEPLVNPEAALLKLESTSDWSSKSANAPIPPRIITETYLDQESGLSNPILSIPSTPIGATHLLTNQYLDSISLSAMDSNSALSVPSLDVIPQSGTYNQPVNATVNADDDLYTLWYRENVFGASWKPYNGPINVSYSSEWQFYAKGINSGINSPIVTRSYSFDIEDISQFDSDNDSVPDFVEVAKGLDPKAGSDSDSDGVTDLDEMINGTDPADDNSKPEDRSSPFNGEGFMILAQAYDHATGEATEGNPDAGEVNDDETSSQEEISNQADGVPITLHGLTSNLLASSPVRALFQPVSLAGQLAATIKVGTPVTTREWVILNSPQYFDLEGPAPRVRGGREIYKVIQRPVQNPPAITPILNGQDIDADASAWITAANTAYNNFEQVDTITSLRPVDNTLAILAESAIYTALGNLEDVDQDSLNVPRDTEDASGRSRFTIFGNREGDIARTALSPAMYQALLAEGLSFEDLLASLQNAVTSSVAIESLGNALYSFHIAHSEPTAAEADVIPLLPMPIDALRALLESGSLPETYNGAAPEETIIAAVTAMNAALDLLDNAYRPTATWTVEVATSTDNSQHYAYNSLTSGNPVAFFEAGGYRINLDRGLGLALGMRFSVTGYTDVSGPEGHDAMELLSLNVVSVPAATNTDLDGDLLDDEWEKFFFGDTAAVSGYGAHPVHGYSYLQLYLIGHDPRDECEEVPEETKLIPMPENLDIQRLQSGTLAVVFSFPDTYFNAFDFTIMQSEDLTQFGDLTVSAPLKTDTNQYRIDLGAQASSLPSNFFKLVMKLASD